MDNIVVVPGSSELHAHTFATALGCGVSHDPAPCDWALFVGVTPEISGTVRRFKELGAKTCGYWIGSDSLCALQSTEYRANVPVMDLHIAVHERIQKELAAWKVDSRVIYPCARNFVPDGVHPTEKAVGVYSPTPGPNDLYMFEECIQIAEENPTLRFIFFGASYDALPPNVQDAGKLPPEKVSNLYEQFSVILRLCRHDGFPVGGIEAKIRGLHVIENFPYKGFLFAETMEDVNRYLADEDTHKPDLGPWPAWYRENCSPSAFKKSVEREMKCV